MSTYTRVSNFQKTVQFFLPTLYNCLCEPAVVKQIEQTPFLYWVPYSAEQIAVCHFAAVTFTSLFTAMISCLGWSGRLLVAPNLLLASNPNSYPVLLST